MDRLTIVIETGNAAFADRFGAELSNVLEELARKARLADCTGDFIGAIAMDSNGNRVACAFGDIGMTPSV